MEDPDVHVSQEYDWYLCGCRVLREPPLPEWEFWKQYGRYRRCTRVLEAYERRKKEFKKDRNVAEMIREIRLARDRLSNLGVAVMAGRGMSVGSPLDDEEGMGGVGGIGVPANLGPVRPVLAGAAAKLLPPLDPEPQWRDP